MTAIATGSPSCVLISGRAKCWGADTNWSPVDVPGLGPGVTATAAGGGHACAVTSAGGVKCWGTNEFGQLGDGTTADRSTPGDVSGLTSGVTAIAAGTFHTCAVMRAGGLKCWGLNAQGMLGDGTEEIRLRPVNVVGFGRLRSMRRAQRGRKEAREGTSQDRASPLPGREGRASRLDQVEERRHPPEPAAWQAAEGGVQDQSERQQRPLVRRRGAGVGR